MKNWFVFKVMWYSVMWGELTGNHELSRRALRKYLERKVRVELNAPVV